MCAENPLCEGDPELLIPKSSHLSSYSFFENRDLFQSESYRSTLWKHVKGMAMESFEFFKYNKAHFLSIIYLETSLNSFKKNYSSRRIQYNSFFRCNFINFKFNPCITKFLHYFSTECTRKPITYNISLWDFRYDCRYFFPKTNFSVYNFVVFFVFTYISSHVRLSPAVKRGFGSFPESVVCNAQRCTCISTRVAYA